MEQIENNAAEAIRDYLMQFSALALAANPTLWDADKEAEIPRLVIKASLGQELVYRYGVYRLGVEITHVTKVKHDVGGDVMADIQKLLFANTSAHENLSNEKFYCYAVEAGTSSNTPVADRRERKLMFSVVGADLERFGAAAVSEWIITDEVIV